MPLYSIKGQISDTYFIFLNIFNRCCLPSHCSHGQPYLEITPHCNLEIFSPASGVVCDWLEMQTIGEDFKKILTMAADQRADFLRTKDASDFDTWRSASEVGDAGACFLRAVQFEIGIGEKQNDKEAFKWYHKAAAQGIAAAQCALGHMYFLGYGVAESDAAAALWFQQAADQGDSEAKIRLNEILNKNNGLSEAENKPRKTTLRKLLGESLQILKMFEFIKILPKELAKIVANSTVSEGLLFAAIDGEIKFSEFVPIFPLAMLSQQFGSKADDVGIEQAFFGMHDAYSKMALLLDDGHSEVEVMQLLKGVTENAFKQVLAQIAEQSATLQNLRNNNGDQITGLTELRTFDSKTGTFYVDTFRILLSRLAEVVTRADGVISTAEQTLLKNFKRKLFEGPMNETNVSTISAPNTNGKSAMDELKQLIGLGSVKKEVQSLVNYLTVQKQRKSKGLPTPEISLHFVFTGAPGTGKTTVARIIGRILMDLGFLKKGHLIETARQDIVAGFVGQTAIKTSEKIDTAMDGILFIDEAYTLSSSDGTNDFGQEAIDTLLKRMEDNRDRLSVIVAGYPDEMQQFVESNPGLQSRFTRFINFEDYTPAELFHILDSIAKQNQYKISPEASKYLEGKFKNEYDKRSKTFGNGRFVRNTFQKAIQKQADRIVESASLDDEVLVTLVPEDFH